MPNRITEIHYWLQDCQKLVDKAREKQVQWQMLKAKGHHRAGTAQVELENAMGELENKVNYPPEL